MRLRSPGNAGVALVACLLALGLLSAPAAAENLGIPIQLGDSASSAIAPAGDFDSYVFEAFGGTVLTAILGPRGKSPLQPTLQLLGPTGAPIDLTGFLNSKKQKLVLKKLVLPVTGVYALRVGGTAGSAGDYQLKTKGAPIKSLSFRGLTLNPGGTAEIGFSGNTDTLVKVKAKSKGIQFEAVSVRDPEGEEIQGARELFKPGNGKTRGQLFLVGGLGEYAVGFGNASAGGTLDISVKFKHARAQKRKLEVSPLEPIVDSVAPAFGRPGAKITIHGQNFQEGDLVVLFGDVPGKRPGFESEKEIDVLAPEHEGLVDITVYNPDGQEGILTDGFQFIAPPPDMTTITPAEGPDSGGTVVDIMGESLGFVERVELGGVAITGPITIVDAGHIRFTTEAHAPGRMTVVIRDTWNQTDSRVGGFEFAAVPRLDYLDPLAGTFEGGSLIDIVGVGLRADDRVLLDGAEIAAVTFVSDKVLQFTAPPHPKGKVIVFVRDPWSRDSTGLEFEYNDGTFQDKTPNSMPSNSGGAHYGAKALAFGDLDGDKQPDLVLGMDAPGKYTEPTRILLNKSGAFRQASESLKDKFDANDLALGDLDGDGDLDLVITMDGVYYKSYISYRYTTSYGRFYYWFRNPPFSSTRILMNDGEGTFTLDRTKIPNPWVKKGDDILQGVALDLGDLDGDSDLDLVVTRNKNALTSYWWGFVSYWSNGGFKYYYKSYQFSPKYDKSAPATRILLNDGKASFTHVSSTNLPPVSDGDMFAGDDVLIGDVDGDKDLDIVVTGDGAVLRDSERPEYVKGSKTRILVNDGYAYFTNATSSVLPDPKTGDDWGGTALALGDLDGDQIKDLVVALGRPVFYTDAGGKTIYLPSTRTFKGTETGKLGEAALLPPVRADGKGEMWRAVAVEIADPEGDGTFGLFLVDRTEVLVENPQTGAFNRQVSSTRFLLKESGSTLSDVTRKMLPNPVKTGDYYRADALVLGDLDGDGKLDMFLGTTLETYLADGKFPTRFLKFE